MVNRRDFLGTSAGLGVTLLAGAACSTQPASAPRLANDAVALTEVFGDGMKLTAVAVHYDTDIDSAKLTATSFTVPDRTVTRTYANTTAAVDPTGHNGRFVIIELSPNDPAAALWETPQGGGPGANNPASATPSGSIDPGAGGPPKAGQSGTPPTIKNASTSVTQVRSITAADGSILPAMTQAVSTNAVVNPIVDEFHQLRFNDPATNTMLDYNLFIPRGYDPGKRYPMVLFMHDASVVGAPAKGPLVQGLGAVSWASPGDQARHESFVVAPQYPTVVVDDTYLPTALFDATVNLVHSLGATYSIDDSRIYATGQSMGAMMTIGMNIRHPELFAASYVVAGQWPTEQTGPLARKRLWITVSQGDSKAYPAENDITTMAERGGATVSRAVWDGHATQEQFSAEVAAITTPAASINYVALDKGTTLPAGASQTAGASEHMGTWHVAYGIPGIRDWIMQQHS